MTPLDPDPLRPPEMDPARVNPYRPVHKMPRRQGCAFALLACIGFWAALGAVFVWWRG